MNSHNQVKCNVLLCKWGHHLEDGGWGDICEKLKKSFHDGKSPIDMYTAYEYQVRDKVQRPYVAFFHQVVSGYERSLKKILNSKVWAHNQKFFLGGFVFSKSQQVYLESKNLPGPIRLVKHPTQLMVKKWDLKFFLKNPIFLHVGVHCRNVDFFAAVAKQRRQAAKYIILAPRERDYILYLSRYRKAGIQIRARMNKDQYNGALASVVVFINLSNSAANNTVLECIARGTPILINKVGGVENYLGEKYPLYYSNKKQAQLIINKITHNQNILNHVSAYLLKRKHKFSIQQFLIDVEKGLKIMIKK